MKILLQTKLVKEFAETERRSENIQESVSFFYDLLIALLMTLVLSIEKSKAISSYPPPPPLFPTARRVALDLYRARPLVFRKLPDLGIATLVKISPPNWSAV